MSDPFIGQIMIFAGTFAPRGWALCNGQELKIQEHNALYALLSTTYGGDGVNTFAVPDLRGRAPIHVGQGPGLTNHNLGAKGGAETVVLDQTQLPAHTHGYTPHALKADGSSTDPVAGGYAARVVDGSGTPTPAFAPAGAATPTNRIALAADTTGATGTGQGHPNMPPYLAVNYIIALEGVFPSRN